MAIQLPFLRRRNTRDVADYQTGEFTTLDYLIDEDHLVRRLQTACPSLVIHEAGHDRPEIRHVGQIAPISDPAIDVQTFDGGPPDWGMLTDPEQWPGMLDAWILSETETEPSAESPVAVTISPGMFNWPVRYDTPEFALQFGGLFTPRKDIRFLAATALVRMQESHEIDIGFRDQIQPRSQHAFIGVHLRVEKDAKAFNWMGYDHQLNYIKDRLKQHGEDPDLPPLDQTVLYVASGDLSEIRRFAADVAPLKVVTKHDLLEEETLAGAVLRNLTWDQQALVDLLILERAGYFIGTRYSTFSWYLAIRRAAVVNRVIGGYPEDCWIENPETRRRSGCKSSLAENEEWRDDLSALIGDGHNKAEPQFARTTWP